MNRDLVDVLRRVRDGPRARPRPGERCELCDVAIGEPHAHIVRLGDRSLLCACRPCWLLFTAGGAGGGRYRAVPERRVELRSFALSPQRWAELQVPVSVAFLFRNSTLERMVAFYPSPAGATESLLPMDAWDGLVAAHPVLATLEADVEALLVRTDGGHGEAFVVPIDVCYGLVGRLRQLWRGFDGGSEARAAIDATFDEVRRHAEAEPLGATP